MKSEHNIIFGHAPFHQIIRDAALRAVVLNPNLSVLDVDVQHGPANAFLIILTHVDQFIMVALRVKNGFDFNLTVGRFMISIFFDQSFHVGSVLF